MFLLFAPNISNELQIHSPRTKSDNGNLSTNVNYMQKLSKNTCSVNNIVDIETESVVYNKISELDILKTYFPAPFLMKLLK
jgi:hypothetical protein